MHLSNINSFLCATSQSSSPLVFNCTKRSFFLWFCSNGGKYRSTHTQVQQENTNVHTWFDVRLVSNAIVMVTLPRSFARTNEHGAYPRNLCGFLCNCTQTPRTDEKTDRKTDRRAWVSARPHSESICHQCYTFHCDKNSMYRGVLQLHYKTHSSGHAHISQAHQRFHSHRGGNSCLTSYGSTSGSCISIQLLLFVPEDAVHGASVE